MHPRADKQGYGIGCQVLRDLGLTHLQLITNHPYTPQALGGFGLSIDSFVPIEAGSTSIAEDECVRGNITAEQLASLPPAFAALGEAGADSVQLAHYPELPEIHHVHTAGNSPAMCDAAAVVLLGDAELGKSLGLQPRGRLVASTTACGEPLEVLAGCITATEQLLRENSLSTGDIDLFEIHEAFAATMIKAERELHLDTEKLNVNGGVIALGHPMGATGAIMTGTLLDEMERQALATGLVAASGAAGSGSALLITRQI